MSNDISTMYTRKINKEQGGRGYGLWKTEKITEIRPREYGGYLAAKKGRRK